MVRHINTITSLKKSKQKQKEATRIAFEQALDRLSKGEPLYTDGRLTIDNLWKEAQLSRSTLARYPEFKGELKKVKSGLGKKYNPADELFDKNRELMREVRELRTTNAELRKEYKKFKDAAIQEIMILNRKIEKMKKASLAGENVVSLSRSRS